MFGRGLSNGSAAVFLALSLSLGIALPSGAIAQAEIIVDQADADTSSIGTWIKSSGADPYAGVSLFSNSSASRYSFHPALPAAGEYEVWAWWTWRPGRADEVPYHIEHDGGTATVLADQQDQSLAGQWQLLGRWSLTPGLNGIVTVSGENGQASVDAIRLVAASGTPAPETPEPPAEPAPGAEIIVDQGDDNTSSIGTWIKSNGANPYENISLFSDGLHSRYSFIPQLPDAAEYEVWAWWTWRPGRADNVPYRIGHDGGIATVIVNQRDESLAGRWYRLGTYAMTPGSNGTVTISAENGQANADAVRFVALATAPDPNDGPEPAPPPEPEPEPTDSTPATVVVVDQDDVNTSSTGSWKRSSGEYPYAGKSMYANKSSATFTWYPALTGAGSYDVYVWWTYHKNRGTNVPYVIQHDAGIATVHVDQRNRSLGGSWQLLGTYELTPGANGMITVSAQNGQASADAVRLVPVDLRTGDPGNEPPTGNTPPEPEPPVNEPPPNQSPTIAGDPDSIVTVGTAYQFTPVANDPDGDTVTFSVVNKPAWANFDADSGALGGTPDAADAGSYDAIEIVASDGQATARLGPFSIDVEAIGTRSIVLNWQPPTENTDGSALTDLAGYRICYGTSPDNMNNWIDVTNPGVTSYVVDNLAPAIWTFEVFAINSQGTSSDPSNSIAADLR